MNFIFFQSSDQELHGKKSYHDTSTDHQPYFERNESDQTVSHQGRVPGSPETSQETQTDSQMSDNKLLWLLMAYMLIHETRSGLVSRRLVLMNSN